MLNTDILRDKHTVICISATSPSPAGIHRWIDGTKKSILARCKDPEQAEE